MNKLVVVCRGREEAGEENDREVEEGEAGPGHPPGQESHLVSPLHYIEKEITRTYFTIENPLKNGVSNKIKASIWEVVFLPDKLLSFKAWLTAGKSFFTRSLANVG